MVLVPELRFRHRFPVLMLLNARISQKKERSNVGLGKAGEEVMPHHCGCSL